MKIVEQISDLNKTNRGCVLTIGNFDGMHLGHQEILAAAKQTAAKRRTPLLVLTFEPHPLAILHPQETPGVLTPVPLKKYLLAELGVDCLFVLRSTRQLLALSAEDFVQQFIVKNIQPSVLVEGEGFNFGSGRTGNVQLLQKLGPSKGFEVVVVNAKEIKLPAGRIVKVSSTIIRNLLETGQVAEAAVALGRPYRLIGQIVPGQGRAKQLGFPTLNLQPPKQLIPAEAVYAGFVEIGHNAEQVCKTKDRLPAALSIGRAETLGSNHPLAIEAHILTDQVGNLPGKWLAMDFIKRLRDQQKFDTDAELSAQIAKDCQKAKNILATEEAEKNRNYNERANKKFWAKNMG